MNPTTRAIFQSVLTSDPTLTLPERAALQRTISGEVEEPTLPGSASNEPLLITQKKAAELLSVSRVTIWRMTKDGLLHPVEILPGTCRYSRREVAALALHGMNGGVAGRREVSAA